jgi:hypothetical protein
VAAARRQMGWSTAPHCSRSQHVLNRAPWAALALRRRLLVWWGRTLVTVGGTFTGVLDETWARRWGRRLTTCGHDRDPLASSTQRSGTAREWRWMVLTLVITPPWTPRSWALPGWRGPAPTPEVRPRLGRRPKTVPHGARPMILVERRGLPGGEIPVIGDQASSVHELGGAWARGGVRLLAPRRREAAL